MKKILLILLALTMCISMCACGGDSNPSSIDDGSIELTLDNYKQFLNTSLSAKSGGEESREYTLDGRPITRYDSVVYTMNVEGLSTNFNYVDVVVTAKITINADAVLSLGLFYDTLFINTELEVTTDIAGNGKTTGREKAGETDSGNTLFVDWNSIESNYEIISVKGKVVPA